LCLDCLSQANLLASERATKELDSGRIDVRADQVAAILRDRLASALDFLGFAELVKPVHFRLPVFR
jgi:hypothetical protein